MNKTHHNTDSDLSVFAFVSNELQEEFSEVIYSLDDIIIID